MLRVFLVLLLMIGGYAAYLLAGHNFHTVAPGLVYRSASMNPDFFAEIVRQNGIKSVFSLIGTNAHEVATAQALGVQYVAYPLSERQEVNDDQIETILSTLRAVPKPVLIHCKAGSDRTGLVAALYCYALQGQPAAIADNELSWRYGHLPDFLGFSTGAMDRSFRRYVTQHAPGSYRP